MVRVIRLTGDLKAEDSKPKPQSSPKPPLYAHYLAVALQERKVSATCHPNLRIQFTTLSAGAHDTIVRLKVTAREQ
jgi:hypothetical protein